MIVINTRHNDKLILVRMEGLEPTSLAALDPKSSASTNFATSAYLKWNAKVLNSNVLSIVLLFFFIIVLVLIKNIWLFLLKILRRREKRF